jgi:hypothetical protein
MEHELVAPTMGPTVGFLTCILAYLGWHYDGRPPVFRAAGMPARHDGCRRVHRGEPTL